MEIRRNNRLYTPDELIDVTYDVFRTAPYIVHIRHDRKFMERLMLAVTEVNECEACSYVHTKMALAAGMDGDEIKKMLAGMHDDVPADQLPAVMFAEHYAESRGKPDREAWDRVVEIYGKKTASGILAAIRMMMMGNVFGIPSSSLAGRLTGKSDPRSSLLYELRMMAVSGMSLPLVLIKALVSYARRAPLV